MTTEHLPGGVTRYTLGAYCIELCGGTTSDHRFARELLRIHTQ